MDLPWNPARLEQRNGRIDRKLQPSPRVWCLHFVFDQREEDIVLDALVRKTERIRTQLGSVGQVIGDRITARLSRDGIRNAQQLAAAVEAEQADERDQRARKDLDDDVARRQARLKRELDDLRSVLATSKDRVGVEPSELRATVNAALLRAHGSLDGTEAGMAGAAALFKLDPTAPPFNDPGWADAFDDLRDRRRCRGSGSPSGAPPVRSAPSPSAHRHCPTAPRRRASCSCTSSTVWSGGCCLGSSVRGSSPGFSVSASSPARERSPVSSCSAALHFTVRMPRVCTRRSSPSQRRGSRRHATMRPCAPSATVGERPPLPSLMRRCVTHASRRPIRLPARAPGRERMPKTWRPDAPRVHLLSSETVLEPHLAVVAARGDGWQVLVRTEAQGVEPDRRGALAGWEATPHQRFERLLRDTGVPTGLLVTDETLRMMYAPKGGESSAWFEVPLRALGTVGGRSMLGGIKLLLDRYRLFGDAAERRLPALLEAVGGRRRRSRQSWRPRCWGRCTR